ncbi:MAG: HlyD family type I secretion periplasmic adaptor subunit, partial [Deltaproteobacteria bacterium]|nr:HlyD family type I secretion periplasmic adaptor subunit [Deltaproteobacteria bacterium]
MSDSEKKSKSPGLFQRMPAEDIDFAADIRTSIMAQSPRGGRAILWGVIALVGALIYWASISEVEQTTRGQGKVVPASQIQTVQNMEGGILSEVLVKVGDTVKKDQL